ncbi:MAG: glycine cleavage system aminomethyltransferase GcvT [Rhodospirillales bacterium]
MSDSTPTVSLPLDELHRSLGAKMVAFAGYSMPIQYPTGIITEHQATRSDAGLFDVSHMGQVRLHGANADKALETIVPGDIIGLNPGRVRYTMFTNDAGGILDDLMVARDESSLLLVINASRKAEDIAHMTARIGDQCDIEVVEDRALLALQGPKAVAVMSRYAAAARHMMFMHHAHLHVSDEAISVTRSGYTGEDGFEMSVPVEFADEFARLLLNEPEVKPVGLGARDSLRLEAGLCLYGNDIDETTTPIEAGLAWTISKRRREEGGYPGHDVIARQLAEGPPRKRVGLRIEGRVPARAGAEIADKDGNIIGSVTSGGFGPSVDGPVAMGYVTAGASAPDTKVDVIVRGKPLAATVSSPTLVPHRYHTV